MRTADAAARSVLELEDASVRVDGRVLWRDADLSVGAGEFVAVLGPNGAGKSTLVRAILGLHPLDSGRVRVLGGTPAAAADRVAYLPQRRSFDRALPVRGIDVVRLGLDGARWGVPIPGATRWSARARAEAARVRESIALVGATDYAERPIGRLSGGEQQRLLVAQAVVSRPALLLLDEPLDSLDDAHQTAVAEVLDRICHEDGVTVVMVTHDVDPIRNSVDRIVRVADGRVDVQVPVRR